MSLAEYQKNAEDEDFVPGWDAIDACIRPLYGNQKPRHYGSPLHTRAILGGNAYLDGFSIYPSNKGYQHLITYGLTELYYNEESLGEEFSKWGFELTMKYRPPKESAPAELDGWVTSVMLNVARSVNTQLKPIAPLHTIDYGRGQPVNRDMEGWGITAFLAVEDTELMGTDSIHGRVEFLQLVGITDADLQMLREDRSRAAELVELMKADDPDLVLDFSRAKSYHL
jgi:hypothetical protein